MSLSGPIKVYLGYGNITVLRPYADIATSSLLDMSGVTKVAVCVGSVESDSDAQPTEIAWAQDANGDWLINLKLGLVNNVVAGDEQTVRVVVYDGDYPNGLVLTDSLCVDVVGPC